MVGGAALLRSSRRLSRFPLPSSSSPRSFSSASALRNLSHHHRPIPNPTTPSLLRRHIRLLPSFYQTHFASLSSSAAGASPTHSPPPEFSGVQDEVVDKLGFEKVSEDFIGVYNSKALLFRHKKTGAQVASLSNGDELKVFGIVFKTPPNGPAGAADILASSVLCGSRKYPMNEPFKKFGKRSLGTYQLALTRADRACFSGACTNTKEFYNLIDVHLDAVFFPRCVEDLQIFKQQGWHYELSDPSEDISYKGVAFNKNKEIYSRPDMMLRLHAQQALFPDNGYGVYGGGDPNFITKLTFEVFKEFHCKYYHPSNARIWFYGDDDPTERLRILSEYLDMFDASSAADDSRVEPQKLFSEPVRIIQKYPSGEGGDSKKKSSVCFSWLLSDQPLDLETQIMFGLLSIMMFTTPASLLSKILLESGLGEEVCGGFDVHLLQQIFSIGMNGVSEDDIQKVKELVMSTVKKLAEEGFDTDTVEASINILEFNLRKKKTRSCPRGMFLMNKSIEKWIYDMDPFEHLKYDKYLMAVKAKIQKEGSKAVLSPLIEKFILNNPHRVVVELLPDPQKASNDKATEKEILEKYKAGMTKGDLAELARATQELRLKVETPDPPEVLRSFPNLGLQDIPREPIPVPTEVGDIHGVKVLQHELFTSDVVHVEVVFDMSSIDLALLPFVPFFCQSLLEMGTKDLSFVQLNQLIERKTGGISVYPWTSSVRGKEDPCSHIILRGKAMARHAEDLFLLINCVLQEVQIPDKQRFKQFVSQNKARTKKTDLELVATRMDSKLNVAGWISEMTGGLSYMDLLEDIEGTIDQFWDECIFAFLEDIRKSLISRNGCVINMTAERKNLTNCEKFVSKFLDLLPSNSPFASTTLNGLRTSQDEAICMPTQVNSVGKAANIYDAGYELKGSAYVISNYLRTWLEDHLRISAGAYGGFCKFNCHSGVFSFLSNCDRKLYKTLDAYDQTGDFLRKLEMDDDAVKDAIIGTIGFLDRYQYPSEKGYNSLLHYLVGFTEEERQRRREEILSTSLKDFKEFADAMDAVKDKGVVVLMASKADVDAAVKERMKRYYNSQSQAKKAL